MNKKELIEIAKECGAWRMQAVDHRWCNENYFIFTDAELNIFAHRIEAPHKQRIAELDKDCEILQTNYDAARQASRFTADVADQALVDLKAAEKQIEQLREALGLLLDCAIHGYDMPEDHSYAIISRNALEQTK